MQIESARGRLSAKRSVDLAVENPEDSKQNDVHSLYVLPDSDLKKLEGGSVVVVCLMILVVLYVATFLYPTVWEVSPLPSAFCFSRRSKRILDAGAFSGRLTMWLYIIRLLPAQVLTWNSYRNTPEIKVQYFYCI